jgi:hypothetical protein
MEMEKITINTSQALACKQPEEIAGTKKGDRSRPFSS